MRSPLWFLLALSAIGAATSAPAFADTPFAAEDLSSDDLVADLDPAMSTHAAEESERLGAEMFEAETEDESEAITFPDFALEEALREEGVPESNPTGSDPDWALDSEHPAMDPIVCLPEDPAAPEDISSADSEFFISTGEDPDRKRRERLGRLEDYYNGIKGAGVISCWKSSELPLWAFWQRLRFESFVGFRDDMNDRYKIVQTLLGNDKKQTYFLWPTWGQSHDWNMNRPLYNYVMTSQGYGFMNCNEWAVSFALAATLHGLNASFCQAAAPDGGRSPHAFTIIGIPWQPERIYLADPYYLINTEADYGGVKRVFIRPDGQIVRYDEKDSEKAEIIANLKIGRCSNWISGNGTMAESGPFSAER